jgi:uncharacterized protein (DUF2267 family)
LLQPAGDCPRAGFAQIKNTLISPQINGDSFPMNKKELTARVAEKLGGVSQTAAAKAIDSVFESIAEGLQKDGIVTIGKWGTYSAEDMG